MSAQGQSSGDLERSTLPNSGSDPEAGETRDRANLDLQTADHEESDGDDASDTTSLFDPSEANEPVDEDHPAWEFVVHFHNFRPDHFPNLDRMLLDSMTEIFATRDIWRQVVEPILYDLEEIVRAKSSEAPFVAMVSELREMLLGIRGLGREMIRTLFRVLATVRTAGANDMRALGRADEIPVNPHAWTCLLYVRGGYRAFYRRLVHDLLPILHDWHTWAWPHPPPRADGVRLVAFLVRRRIARFQFDHPWADPLEYMAWFWDFCPDAADWLGEAGVDIGDLLPAGEEL